MIAEIINIGDELLIGQVINSNAAKMSQYLNQIGIKVDRVDVIGDQKEAITNAIDKAMQTSDVILITGGLGPTKDDITKLVLCEYFNTKLVFSEEAYKELEEIFARNRYPMTETNRQQSFLPEACTQIPNKNGTARGMWFNKGGKILISMPGVPFEMTAMMENYVVPHLKELFLKDHIIHQTIMVHGIGESFLSDKISDWETSLPPFIKLAYLPQPGIIRLRLTAMGTDNHVLQQMVNAEVEKLRKIIPEYIIAESDTTMEEIIVSLLIQKNKTLSIAESCTGGYISHLLTSISGCSACFKGSVIAYSNEIKTNILNVSANDLAIHGVVSEQVVKQMALNVRDKMGSDYGVATSGIAGPTGAVEGKPVGTIWIAVSNGDKTEAQCFHFSNDRTRNIQRSTIAALNMLRKIILSDI